MVKAVEERNELAQARRERDDLRDRAGWLANRIQRLESVMLDMRRRQSDPTHRTVFQGFWHGPSLDAVLM